MQLISNSSETDNDFKEIMAELNDEELKEVLRKRSLYQKEAAAQAVSEAVKRGLINSESDLSKPEFREIRLKRQLFPEIKNDEIRFKVKRSIIRSLIFVGLIPAILGTMRLLNGDRTHGFLMIGFALSWTAIALNLYNKFSVNILFVLWGLAAPAFLYAVQMVLLQPEILFIDKFIVTVVFLLTAYGVIFLKKLGK